MGTAQPSYQFHSQLETLSAFCRREWRAIAVFGGGFCVVMLAGIFTIDPAFFYPRLQTDPLNYWLKAKSLVEQGHTSARWAVNIPPFSYAAMPGVIRAPLLLVFTEFDQQLRAMQLLNIPIVAGVALLSAYVLSWVVPSDRHRWVVAFAFAFTLFNPVWVANVFLPLVDAPYALATLVALVLSIRLVCAEGSLRERIPLVLLYALVFVIAFSLRFTGAVVLLFAAALALGKHHAGPLVTRKRLVYAIAGLLVVAILIALNSDAIFGRYLREPLYFLRKASKSGILLNLFGAGIPAQVIPTFVSGFVVPPVGEYYKTQFFWNLRDSVWVLVGLSISAVMLAGMFRSRQKLMPEILYFLAPVPILALMLPSTARYLMTYQAFVWMFCYIGASWIYSRMRHQLPAFVRTKSFAATAVFAVVAVVIGIRAWRLVGSASEKKFAVGASAAPRYVTDVADTFRGLREFLETLPGDRTLLVSDRGSMGRWKVISGREYYYPDSAMKSVVASRDIYLLVECGTMDGCQRWDAWRKNIESRIGRYGQFHYDSVYAVTKPRARAEVFRIRNTE